RLAPATLKVNSIADNISDKTHLTLREAILASEGLYALNATQLALVSSGPLGTHNDTIVFAAGLAGSTINLSIVRDTSVGNSAFAIPSGETLTIQGLSGASGITLAMQSGSSLRAFDVQSGGSLTLQFLTLRGFTAQGGAGGGSDLGGAGGGAAGLGGAI